MPEAYIVDAVRTPVGRRGGTLAAVHPADLGAATLSALMDRTGIDPGAVEDVVYGCVDTIGPQAGDIARTAWLAAGLPEHVPGTTVDRQCGSSQQAVHFAAQAVLSGTADVVVAGGVQQMSAIPISAAMLAGREYGFGDPFTGSVGWQKRYGTQEISQFRSAEMIAEKWSLTREDMEAFAVRSHERALAAGDNGYFDREIVSAFGLDADETPRAPNWDKIRSLPTLVEGGRLTAAVSSQIADASAALLIVNEDGLRTHGLTPRARIHHLSVRAADPVWMLTAPIPATEHALAKTGLDPRRHRPGRDQRGVRVRRPRVGGRQRRRPGQGERQRRRHRAGAPARGHRCPTDDDAAARVGAARRQVRPADDVRGRRPGQRHDHRAT